MLTLACVAAAIASRVASFTVTSFMSESMPSLMNRIVFRRPWIPPNHVATSRTVSRLATAWSERPAFIAAPA
jgi:hypothetical protein